MLQSWDVGMDGSPLQLQRNGLQERWKHLLFEYQFLAPFYPILSGSLCIAQVYGLDINPRAIKASWINLYLNALNEDGSPVYDHEGKTLLDRVEFHESDLLQYCRTHKISLDRVVGCIPQVNIWIK